MTTIEGVSERVATLEGRTNEQAATITDVRTEIRLGFAGLNFRIDRLFQTMLTIGVGGLLAAVGIAVGIVVTVILST